MPNDLGSKSHYRGSTPAVQARVGTPSDLGNQSQFAYLYDALTSKYPGLTGDPGGTSVFQFVLTPMAANWSTGNDANAYSWANAVPLNLDGFYAPGDGLDAAYRTLINSIQPANYQDNPAYLQTQTILGGLASSQSQLIQDANAAYYQWAANNTSRDGTVPETKAAWLLDPLGGASWNTKLQDLQQQINNYSQKLSAIVKSMDAALALAQAAASTDTMPISTGGPAISVPRVTIGGNLGEDLARWAAYGEGQFDFQAVINQSTTITYPWKTTYTTTVTTDCWGASKHVSVNTSRIIEDVSYELRVSIVGLNTYKITRGAWYDPDYVSPNVKISPGATVTGDTFFGLGGSLHLVPETIFVMYRPTFQLTVSTQTYQQQFVANADVDVEWIDLFGIRFAFNGLASLQPVDNGNDTYTLTFASPPTAAPQILGVTSKTEYNGSTQALRAVRAQPPPRRPPLPQVTAAVQPQAHSVFGGFAVPTVINVARQQPFGSAPFVIYDTATKLTLGAGDCPALTAQPPYVSVSIPAAVPFTVQNLSPTVAIDVTY